MSVASFVTRASIIVNKMKNLPASRRVPGDTNYMCHAQRTFPSHSRTVATRRRRVVQFQLSAGGNYDKPESHSMPNGVSTNPFHNIDKLLAAMPGPLTRRRVQQAYQQLEKDSPQELRLRLAQDPDFKHTLRRWLPEDNAYLTVFNPTHYQALREALAQNQFQSRDGSPWPTAPLGQQGQAQLIPATLDPHGSLAPEEMGAWSHLMWAQRQQLSDLTVDVLDTLGAIWLEKAKSPTDDAIADLDSLLAIRGLKQRTGRSGESRGFREQQRLEIFQSLVQIQNLWLTLGQLESIETTPKGQQKRKIKTIQSRAFVITDRLGQLRLDGCIDVEKFIFRPGTVFGQFLFGPGRQTALLSARALSYDPYRETWEKRLTRYLSWHWRTTSIAQNSHRYSFKTLLHAIDPTLKTRYTQRLHDRLEKALDKLQADLVIESWSYQGSQEDLEVCVLPPVAQTMLATTVEKPVILESVSSELNSQLKKRRKALKLSQATLAQHLEITQAYLSMLENGKTGRLNDTLVEKIYKWLEETGQNHL
jgi:predicted XRE-type DNA-binding protein